MQSTHSAVTDCPMPSHDPVRYCPAEQDVWHDVQLPQFSLYSPDAQLFDPQTHCTESYVPVPEHEPVRVIVEHSVVHEGHVDVHSVQVTVSLVPVPSHVPLKWLPLAHDVVHGKQVVVSLVEVPSHVPLR